MTYAIELTPVARLQLHEITDLRIRRALRDRIDALTHDPLLQGEPLKHELAGFRSVRAASQSYRIVYHVEDSTILVVVVFLGKRKGRDRDDVYEVTKRLLRAGLIEAPSKKE